MKYKKEIENIYNHPKWYYFLPIIGFVTFMRDVIKYTKDSPFSQKGTKEYKIMQEFTNKFFLTLNIFLPVYFLFVIFVFNIGVFVWKGPVRKAGLDIN